MAGWKLVHNSPGGKIWEKPQRFDDEVINQVQIARVSPRLYVVSALEYSTSYGFTRPISQYEEHTLKDAEELASRQKRIFDSGRKPV